MATLDILVDKTSPQNSAEAFARDGFLLLREAIPFAWLEPLRETFDAGMSHIWPVPRGADWRHAYVEDNEIIQAVCHTPQLLDAAGWAICGPFFLAQVEGREPRKGGGAQRLHRDGKGYGGPVVVSALAFLDDFGPENGATRLVPGTHRGEPPNADLQEHPHARTLDGKAGDILVFCADLLHGGTCNGSGERRRSLLINFFPASLRDDHEATRQLRDVHMPVTMLKRV
jgi:hypothetical protein